MEAPICLIESKVDDKLEVNPVAINILSKINQPVVVVAIVGLYRTGKSYLMNKLAGARRGFDVGSTVRAQTKGIWMWCVPHPIKENHTLVLLDTEGLADVERGDGKRDIRIFALAVLLSSALVYNSKGTINQDAMDKLKFVGEISELIKIKSKDNEDEEVEFSSHFPMFIWAVRDFHLGLELDGRQISEDEYLENALKLKTPERTIRDEDYNRLRKRLRVYFGTRKCFTFGLPSADENVLQNLEATPEDLLIFSNVGVKSVRDMLAVNGHRFGELVKLYTDALTNSRFACMEEAVISLADQENRAAVEEAKKYYVDKMKTIQLPTETQAGFQDQSTKYIDEACQIFLKRSFKDDDQMFFQEFMQNVEKEEEGFIAKNLEKSREICDALIKKHSSNIELALAEGTYNVRGGYEKFKEDMKAVEEKFNMERGKGVKAEEVLQEYIKSKQSSEIDIIQKDNALNLKEKEAAEESNRKKISELEEKLKISLEEQKRINEAENEARIQQAVNKLTQKMEEERRVTKEKMEQNIRDKTKLLLTCGGAPGEYVVYVQLTGVEHPLNPQAKVLVMDMVYPLQAGSDTMCITRHSGSIKQDDGSGAELNEAEQFDGWINVSEATEGSRPYVHAT
ncbi:guanylate-binding protein 1-like [Mantella aurantiaca]